MVVRNLLVAASCLGAFVAAVLIARLFCNSLSNVSRSARIQQRVGTSTTLRVLQTGIPGFVSVAQKLVEGRPLYAYSQKLCQALAYRGLAATPEGVLSVVICIACTVVVLFAAAGRVALGLLGAVGFVLLASAFASHGIEARTERMRDALPDALAAMSSCFGAGFSLLQTFDHLRKEVPGPLAEQFGNAASAMQTGDSPSRALARIQHEGGIAELSFVAVALAVQHQTGGSMQRVLDATRESLKEELELRRSLRVHTAQAKLSARVVVGVTIGLLAAMMLLSRDFLAPFFGSAVGMGLLAVALGMQVAGIVLVRRLLRVEVD